MKLEYWTAAIIFGDPLHLVYLGPGRCWVSSQTKLLMRLNFFGKGTWECRNHFGLLRFLDFCKQHRLKTGCDKFDLKNAKTYSFKISNRAFDVKLMIFWLAHEMQAFDGDNADVLMTGTYCLAKSVAYHSWAGAVCAKKMEMCVPSSWCVTYIL